MNGTETEHTAASEGNVRQILLKYGFAIPEEATPERLGGDILTECVLCGDRRTRSVEDAVRESCTACTQREDIAHALIRGSGLLPLDEYPGSYSQPWRTVCEFCGQEYAMTVFEARAWQACPCATRPQAEPLIADTRPGEGCESEEECELEEEQPYLPEGYSEWPSRLPGGSPADDMRAVGFNPIEPFESSYTPWRCECVKCGRTLTPRHSNVLAGAAKSCKFCARDELRRRRVVIGEAFRASRAAEPELKQVDFIRRYNANLPQGAAPLNQTHLRACIREVEESTARG